MPMSPTTLQFTPAEVSAKYPSFFEVYPVSPDNTSIHTIFQHNFEVDKKSLREFFPFDGEGRVKMFSYVDTGMIVDTAYPLSIMILRDVYSTASGKPVSSEVVMSNKLSDGSKFSRQFLAYIKKNAHARQFLLDCLVAYDLCTELPRLPLAMRHDPDAFVQNFYSEIAQAKATKVHSYLTVSPYDIVNASTGKVNSCNSIRGMYNTAPICAASSPTMALIRLEDDCGQLLGRCYVAFSPDYKSFIVQPPYGYMKSTFMDDAEAWISAYINSRLGKEEWLRSHSRSTVSPQIFTDAKEAQFYVDASRSILYRKDWKEIPAIRLGTCSCLVCGKHVVKLVCEQCHEKLFARCGHCHGVTDKTKRFCTKCESKSTVCESCGKQFISAGGKLCDHCRYVNTICMSCGLPLTADKNRKQLDIVPLLGGVFYSHSDCGMYVHNKKCKCGLPVMGKRSNTCTMCACKAKIHMYAEKSMREVRQFKDTLRGDTVNFSASMPINIFDYAIAA